MHSPHCKVHLHQCPSKLLVMQKVTKFASALKCYLSSGVPLLITTLQLQTKWVLIRNIVLVLFFQLHQQWKLCLGSAYQSVFFKHLQKLQLKYFALGASKGKISQSRLYFQKLSKMETYDIACHAHISPLRKSPLSSCQNTEP